MRVKLNNFLANVKPLSATMIGVCFSVFCLAVLGGSVFVVERTDEIKVPDYIQIIIMIFIAGTMFVGLISHNHDRKYSQSETCLSSALSLIDRAAQVILIDGVLSNDRVAWVTCARLIARVNGLREKITTDTHRLVFDAEHDFLRHRFHEILRPGGKELSGAFFCGGDVDGTIGATVLDASHPKNGEDWIPVKILEVVFGFVSFPENYADPLRVSNSNDLGGRKLLRRLGYDGLTDYISFREKFRVVGSDVRCNDALRNKSKITADFIDDMVFSSRYDFDE